MFLKYILRKAGFREKLCELFENICVHTDREPCSVPKGGPPTMEKRFIIKVPPRPAVIRERYAGFLSELNRYLDHYKQGFIDGMNEKFELNEPKKTRPEAN